MAITYVVKELEVDGEGVVVDNGTREVTFSCDVTGLTTTRVINFCADESAWTERLEQQAQGVANKILVGLIKVVPEVTTEE